MGYGESTETILTISYQSYFGGEVSPLGGGGSIYALGAKKLGYFYTFSAPKAPQKILSLFFVNFGEIS